ESRARAAADAARAEAVGAAEAIATARQVAEAQRRKQIALLAATQEAEITGTRQRMAAQSEAAVAADRASARVQEAQADADASALRAAARKGEMLAQAEGQRALIDAENATSAEVLARQIELARLETLPRVVAEMVKPAEKIDSIRIHHVTGLGTATGGGEAAPRTPVNQALDSIMEMAVQLPALKKLGEDLGMSLDSGLAGLTRGPLASPAKGGGKGG
ncbi:MAG: flotillin domain-containing protein, partial [Rubrivivax sp.]|nr:flotillin domain-containing protein [Rubrivivax sp.]